MHEVTGAGGRGPAQALFASRCSPVKCGSHELGGPHPSKPILLISLFDSRDRDRRSRAGFFSFCASSQPATCSAACSTHER